MISTLLRAEAMTAGYGKMAILHEVSLIVAPGELVAVIGPNGAGKSTGTTSPGSGPMRCSAGAWPTCPRAASCFPR